MVGSSQLLDELSRLVKRSPADGTSICAQGQGRHVMRFAYGTIHQVLFQEHLTVTIKAVLGKRVGVASTDTFERASLNRTLAAALALARHAPNQPSLSPLPAAHQLLTTEDRDDATAQAGPEAVLPAIKRVFQLCQGAGASLAGSCALGEDELAVVNSSGVACYAASTLTGAKLVTMYRKLSGFASLVERRLSRLNFDDLLETSLAQCLHRQAPVTLPLGTYEVILEPEAVAELLMWLGSIAFGAKSFHEKTSCVAGRLGEQVMDRRITILDDGTRPEGLRMLFDFEGVPKRRVPLIERGTAAGLVYDSTYGHLYGQTSTGHGLPPDDVEGPQPLHLFLEPGSVPREELIRRCERGILIPRFHYVNGLLNPPEALMTGLTREGAWLIEDGKRKAPITTLRFTHSLVDALRHVVAISKERRRVADPMQESGCAVVPTLHLARLRFTGRSEDA